MIERIGRNGVTYPPPYETGGGPGGGAPYPLQANTITISNTSPSSSPKNSPVSLRLPIHLRRRRRRTPIPRRAIGRRAIRRLLVLIPSLMMSSCAWIVSHDAMYLLCHQRCRHESPLVTIKASAVTVACSGDRKRKRIARITTPAAERICHPSLGFGLYMHVHTIQSIPRTYLSC